MRVKHAALMAMTTSQGRDAWRRVLHRIRPLAFFKRRSLAEWTNWRTEAMSNSHDFTSLQAIFTQSSSSHEWKTTEFEFENPANCFEITPDGRSFSVGDTEGHLITLRISNSGSFEVTDNAHRHTARISDVAFNPTSDLVATCSNDNFISLSSFRADDSKTGSRGMKMRMSGRVRAVNFMEDVATRSNILFSAVDKQICITDCCSGTTYRNLHGHRGAVTGFCTWGGCMIATSSSDKTIRIWDMRIGDAVRLFDPLPKPAPVGSTSFQVDGSGRLLMRGDGEGVVHTFDTTSTKRIASTRIFHRGIHCVRVASARRYALFTSDNAVSLCDFRDVYQISSPHTVANSDDKTVAVRWHPSRATFATLDSAKRLRLWEALLQNSANGDLKTLQE